ncbi:MAG: type II toxin-antitoxin system RatA family toxin [Devosia sp.]
MPNLFFERHVPHLVDRMFDLVNDLEDYPRFLKNVSDMQVKRDEGAEGDVRLAKMTIQFGPISQAYTSRVVASRSEHTITAKAIDGPFTYLNSKWTFEPEGEGSRIRFDIDFKIQNPLIATVAEAAFSIKQGQIIDAFSDEADRRFS